MELKDGMEIDAECQYDHGDTPYIVVMMHTYGCQSSHSFNLTVSEAKELQRCLQAAIEEAEQEG